MPLRHLAPSARFHVAPRPKLVDAIGGLSCPNRIPAFDWNLLLDAARAGRCNGSSLPTLRAAAAALRALEAALGPTLAADLADLASAYRRVLLDAQWEGTLDLQLKSCEEMRPAGLDPQPFSSVEGPYLSVDAKRCPNAAFSEVILPRFADESMALEMERLGDTPNTSLKSDAVYVVCDAASDSSDSMDFGGGTFGLGVEEGDDTGDKVETVPSEASSPPTGLETNLWFRLSPTTKRVRSLKRGSASRRAGAVSEVAAATAASPPPSPPPLEQPTLSVLMLMLDATSRAHLTRMMPHTIRLLRMLHASGGVRLYEFEQYSIVGYNSVPNMIPMLTGVDVSTFLAAPRASSWDAPDASGSRLPLPVWTEFMRRGYATFLAEELHDGCTDLSQPVPSSASKLFYSRFGAESMPHHNLWQAFCQPELRACCNDHESFLQPGRRQCVGNGELPALFLDWVDRFMAEYAERSTPRFGMLNLMSAHEHFMTRLSALDEV